MQKLTNLEITICDIQINLGVFSITPKGFLWGYLGVTLGFLWGYLGVLNIVTG